MARQKDNKKLILAGLALLALAFVGIGSSGGASAGGGDHWIWLETADGCTSSFGLEGSCKDQEWPKAPEGGQITIYARNGRAGTVARLVETLQGLGWSTYPTDNVPAWAPRVPVSK